MNNKAQFSEKNLTKIFISVFAAIILILAVVIVIMLCAKGGDGTEPSDSSSIPEQSGVPVTEPPIASEPLNSEVNIPELKIESVEEQEEIVLITTSYGTMSYSSAFSELIGTDVYFGDGTGCIIFSARVGGGNQTVYSILFNNESGIDVGELQLDGVESPIRVSVVFYEAPSTLAGDDLISYLAAQETFNDIVVSLDKNEGFSSSN